VIQAFYAGYHSIEPRDYDYLCKLDLDLELPPKYFEGLIRRMQADPRLGTCSGKPYYPDAKGRLVSEACGDEMSVGMTKFYRTACFEEIGGFVPEVMWDGIDCHRCRMLGWTARSYDEPELRFVHLRPMGSSQGGMWSGRWRHGRGQWFMGTSFLFMSASALYRTTRPPLLEGGLAMWLGYVGSMLRREPRYPDPEFRSFLRRYQRESLMLGKRRAIERVQHRQATLRPQLVP
jgi:poly-beta-1,6-N-acetyl-D-glucosamine synthase